MINFAFFGTDEFAVTVLDELKRLGLKPALIVTRPDRPQGRRLVLTPVPAKVWAEKNAVETALAARVGFDLFVIASYGKIIPKEIIDLPKFGTLNIHPSLLPQHRGSSPIQTAILNGDQQTGVTIMLLDEEVDHGPIVSQQILESTLEHKNYNTLCQELGKLGAQMLAKIIPSWIRGQITTQSQDHAKATYTKKIEKSDGEIKLTDQAELVYRKFLAYTPWPGIYFFDQNQKRIKITDVSLENKVLQIKKVIPEGKSEMTWADYKRGQQ